MPKLTDIPREIRDQIYSYCLLVDGENMPYDEYYLVSKKYQAIPPSLSLLRVSKKIRAEAMQILYGKNTWRVGPSAPNLDPNCHLWGSYKNLFRHVIVYFHQFDVNPDSAYRYARHKNEAHMDATPTMRKDIFHATNKAIMMVTWAKKMYVSLASWVTSSRRLSLCGAVILIREYQ